MSYGLDAGPLAVAHRGGAALAPENTLAAFARATALGVRYLETDVQLTADGELVCFHDPTVDRVTAGRGPVRRQTLAQMRGLSVAGEPIPTLAELLEAFPGANVTVDLKDRAAIGPLLRLLRRRGDAHRVCVAGAWDGWLEQVRAGAPGVSTALGWRSLAALISGAPVGARARGGASGASGATGAGFAHVPLRLGRLPVLVEKVVPRAHALGLRVVFWTVDSPAVMHRLLDAGADGLITDRPDLLREVLLQRGQWTPLPGPLPRPELRPA